MLTEIKKEMKQYYSSMLVTYENETFHRINQLISKDVNQYCDENPDMPTVLLKSRMHTKIAEYFEPVLFLNSPFFYEMGLRPSHNWGTPHEQCASDIVRRRKAKELYSEKEVQDSFVKELRVFSHTTREKDKIPVFQGPLTFDEDHHCIGYTVVFDMGINGLLAKIQAEKQSAEQNSEKYIFCTACEESCRAVLTIADKFSQAAKEKQKECKTEQQKEYMQMIETAASRVPANPPRSFYEGLAMLWFLREVTATIEEIGISVIGHADKLLGRLYEEDVKKGRITEEKAKELLALWMIPTDVKWDMDTNSWPETSTCVELGGCDEKGNPIFNDVTRLIIEVHKEHGLINPKLNCRYSKQSPQEYINLLSRTILSGHNNFALANDDAIIPGLIRGGVDPVDANYYVNGGCQETMIEGMGHSAGAFFYLLLPALLDFSIRKADVNQAAFSEEAWAAVPKIIEDAPTFEDFYHQLMNNTDRLLNFILRKKASLGKLHRDVHPCPFFSASQKGCLETGKDYTAGGAKYNFSTVCACGIGTLTDSLYAIKTLVYDKKELSLQDFVSVLASNWENNEALRQKCIHLPKYGHGIEEVDRIARRLIDDLNGMITKIPNERGGSFILSMFVYYAYSMMKDSLRATADGRKEFELLNQGISPGQLQRINSLTDAVGTVKTVDYTRISGNSVLDVQLPLGKVSEPVMSAYIRAAGEAGVPTLQPNTVSVNELRDAKLHPEKHKNLIVRISGLSAYFVALEPDVQDEIISRHLYTA